MTSATATALDAGTGERTRARTWWLNAVLAGLGIAGAALIIYLTPYGTALAHGDSVVYYTAAWSVARGDGFRFYDGTPYTRWPPLFPSLIALTRLAGVDPLQSVRLIDSLAFGLTVFVSGHVFFQLIRNRALALAGTLAILLGWPLVLVAYFGLAESLFSLLFMLFLLCLIVYWRSPTMPVLMALAVVGALACLQRYVGVSLVAGAGLALLVAVPGLAVWTRLRHALALGVVSLAPLGLWVARNLALSGSPFGPAWEHKRNTMHLAPNIMVNWIWPEANVTLTERADVGIAIAVGVLVVLGVAAVLFELWATARPVTLAGAARTLVTPVGIVLVIYQVFFVASTAAVQVDVTERMFAPLYPPVILLLVSIAGNAGALLDRRLPRHLGSALVVVLAALWLLRPASRIAREMTVLPFTDGPLGYNNLAWRESDLMGWLRTNPLDLPLYSNAHHPISSVAEVYVHRAGYELDEWLDMGFGSGDTVYYAWFDEVDEKGCNPRSSPCFNPDYSPDDLRTLFEIEPVVERADGRVYRLTWRGA